MKTIINKLKTDLYKVFVKGEADNREIAEVYVLLAIPTLSALFILGGHALK